MHYLFRLLCVCMIGLLPLVGCSESTGNGGHAGAGGSVSNWGTPEVINLGEGEASSPQVAIDPGGNAVAVWEQSDGTRTNIWSNRYTPRDGWSTAELLGERQCR